MSLSEDGVLEVKFASNGIVEYWVRSDGTGAEALAQAKQAAQREERQRLRNPERQLTIAFRHFGASNKDYFWHWALAVGDDVYEIAGWMAVMGPRGVVAKNCMVIPYNTALSQFHGYLRLPATTRHDDSDIKKFSDSWIQTHPSYSAVGPNCQTYTEDLFTFLTGEHLPYPKFNQRLTLHGSGGPEYDERTVWNNPTHKPTGSDPSAVVVGKKKEDCVVS